MRLDRYLADLGAGTRSGLKKAIRRDGVRIGGEWIRDPSYAVDETAVPSVFFEGEVWTYEPVVWYMLNKPAGVLSAGEDRRQPTVLDIIRGDISGGSSGSLPAEDTAAGESLSSIPAAAADDRRASPRAGSTHVRTDLFPVGRLDKETEGLLLVTNDGQTAHRLLSPRFHVDKTYYVQADGSPFSQQDAERFAAGIRYDETLTALPAKLEILGPHEARVTIREGKFHQIRKMIAALGGEKSVVYLRRETFGPLSLDPALQPGQFRRLTEEEVALLAAAAGSTSRRFT